MGGGTHEADEMQDVRQEEERVQVPGGAMKEVLITEQLAGALINLINVGRFPFEYREVKQVEMELYKAIENANIEVTYTDEPEDARSAVLAVAGEPV